MSKWFLNEWKTEWMNEWMSGVEWSGVEWVRAWVSEWMSEWMKDWMNEWMMEWNGTERKGWEGKGVEWMNDMNKCMNAWVNEWINGWIVLIDLLYSGIVLSVSFCHYMTWDEWSLICDNLMKYRLLRLSRIRILYYEYIKQVYYIIKFKNWYNRPLKIYKATNVHMYACVHCSKYNSHTHIYIYLYNMYSHGIGSVPGLRCDTVTVAMV